MSGAVDGAGLDRALVPAAFDRAARGYDLLVGANPGYHRHLRAAARGMGLPDGGAGLRLLDLGCGTGASTAALLRAAPRAHIVAVDASERMLARAAAKTWPPTVTFVHADAARLADAVPPPFDGILAAYLVRNLAAPDAVLRTLAGMLTPGAPLAVHEYSVRDSAAARAVWHAVCWGVIIPAGRVSTGDATLFRHLWRSVLGFDGTARFQRRLRAAGFAAVHREPVTGWQRGILHTFRATAPDGPRP